MPEVRQSDRFQRTIGETVNQGPDARRGFEVDTQPTAMSYTFYVESMDARQREAMPWALYNGYEWKDTGEEERLTLLFSNRSVLITGHHMKPALRYLEGCQLKGVRFHNTSERRVIEAWNQTQADKSEAIITGVTLTPERFSEVIANTLMQGEEDEE